MRRRRIGVVGTALLAHVGASSGYAACVAVSEIAVRGRFVRCEDATFYLEASGAYETYERALEDILARTDRGLHDAVRERLGIDRDATSLLPTDYEARVAVVMVDWRAPITPWRPDLSNVVEFMEQPRELHETVRYWWNGSTVSCEGFVSGAPIDLWVHPPCCDSDPDSPICIVSMNYAESAPEEMSEALSASLDNR